MATSTEERLELLRKYDSSGSYASNDPATGQDPTGRVQVTVDPSNRVTNVQVATLDDGLRSPGALAIAVRDAFDDASVQRHLAGRAGRPASTAPRTVEVPVRPTRRPQMDPNPNRQPNLDLLRDRGHTPDLTISAVGISRNECVQVTLLPASSAGEVEVVEPGWLANASTGQVSNALTEAFEAAYENRGN
ncbi:hypothetical protein [Nocardioides currus]|uniref:Uncharacterized protein n=1 Tax=Nocardioides currus TaxID=2133958 RepID=A0A2R7Z331_9ACTN|nr:hypothetical protein [Nocardioides currus]PUA83038.1 hypothetical protein C7S10_04990 [Nocardioides currus]